MFVARLFDISSSSSPPLMLEERVLNLVVERKSVDDLQNCLIKKSKTYAPLSFFEAQMYKLQQTPDVRRVFLMEGDEDITNGGGDNGISTVGNEGEWVLRRKRVKTMRNQIRGEEWKGVELICTIDKNHSVQYLVDRMAEFMSSDYGDYYFDPKKLHRYRTMEEYKQIVNERMRDGTFLEYLRLRKIKGTGDVTAMKTIRDPTLSWNKEFISPACIARDRKYKSNLEDRATYYVSNNVGGMSRMGNAIMNHNSQSSSASRTPAATSLRKENTIPSTQNSTATKKSKKATNNNKTSNNSECKKCRQELETGQKNNLRHDATCPKKKTKHQPDNDSNDNHEQDGNMSKKKKYNDNNYASSNQYKKKIKAKPTEPIYYNPNLIRRTSLLGGGGSSSGIDDDLIASIHSTRSDLTGGSGLGVGGFELSSSRVKACNGGRSVAKGSSVLGTGGGLSQSSCSSSDNSINQRKPPAVCKSHSSDGVIDLDSPESAVSKATKAASLAVEAASAAYAASFRADNEVIVLDDSDDEGQLHGKPAASATKSGCDEVEVIEID